MIFNLYATSSYYNGFHLWRSSYIREIIIMNIFTAYMCNDITTIVERLVMKEHR